MIKRLILGGLLTTAAATGPMIYYGAPGYWKAVTKKWLPSGEEAPASGGPGAGERAGASGSAAAGESAVLPMSEAFRFDVTQGWITQRWPLASIGLADPRLQGYRVPLVTGTAPTDLAGSLTYYFDSRQQLRRITFDGTTGDARELVKLMTSRYGFTRRILQGAGQFRYEAAHPDGKTVSTLEVRAAQMVNANDPFGRFTVALTLQGPS